MIEKQLLNKKDKLCGGIITPKAYSLLLSIFPKNEIDSIIKTTFNKCTILGNCSFVLDGIDIKIIDRKDLDHYIMNKYLSIGGEVLEGRTISSINFDKNLLTVGNCTYEFKKLIGADGVLSFVRKNLLGKLQKKNFALESFGCANGSDAFTIEFLNKYKGYNWIIPTNNKICFGTGNVTQETNISFMFDHLVEKLQLKNVLRKGAFLPTGNDIYLQNNNVYLVGDAAGLIFPTTGEGIYCAIYSAHTLYNSFSYNLNYSKSMEPICKRIKKELFLNKLIYNDKIRSFIFKIICKNNKTANIIKTKVKQILLD